MPTRFTVVTPVSDRPDYLNKALTSVANQAGDFEIEYIVQDNGINGAVADLLDGWQSKVDTGQFSPQCISVRLGHFVEPDSGMYDAINRGMQKGSGNILAWINSDDIYFPGAFDTVARIFSRYPEIEWLIGKTAVINAVGAVTYSEGSPKAISRAFVQRGYYRADLPFFNWLPQDAIFWRRSLWEKAGPLETSNRLVSDFKLWQSFARFAEPVKVDCLLGAFRHHGNQLTGNPGAYRNELGPRPHLPLSLRFACGAAWLMPNLAKSPDKVPAGNLLVRLLGIRQKDARGLLCSWDARSSSWLTSIQPAI